MTTDHALRSWARGNYAAEAAVELLIRAFAGRFARRHQPWIVTERDDRVWLDAECLRANLGTLSSGERRVLSVAAALAGSMPPIDLADVVCVDRDHLDLILAAFAHAGGSHEHATLIPGSPAGSVRLARPGPLHPWPTDTSTQSATDDAPHVRPTGHEPHTR